ncbi:MAG: MFS transporter [Acidothermus sp.]|nr:MFS transporter [Acidothermus sp.]
MDETNVEPALRSTTAPRRWLTPGVGGVGAASFFSDSGHEIATAVLPSFLTSVLHGSAAALGLIEGFADALTGIAKLFGGPLANDPGRRRRLATGGYLGTALATGAIGLATAVWQVGVLRAAAWASRGIRSPARDALLASIAPPHAYGRAYGLERAGDNLGAVVGPLLAGGLVAWIGVRPTIYVAFVPGILAALAIGVAAREARHRRAEDGSRARPRFAWRALHQAGVVRALLPIALFEFGNVATTLLILRATQLLTAAGHGVAAATSLAIVIYAAHNAFGSAVALGGGRWVDRSGPVVPFALGGVLYVLAYLGFAVGVGTWWWLLISFTLAGSGIGLAETAQSALFARLLPDHLRGSGFGLLGGVQALGDIVATAVVGVLYSVVSPAAGFAYAAGWMAASAVAVIVSQQLRLRTS